MESNVHVDAGLSLPRRKLIIEKRSGLLDVDWFALWEDREVG